MAVRCCGCRVALCCRSSLRICCHRDFLDIVVCCCRFLCDVVMSAAHPARSSEKKKKKERTPDDACSSERERDTPVGCAAGERDALNERHYGALQGLNKAETAAKHGEQQVKIWRRSYDIPPPALDASDSRSSHRVHICSYSRRRQALRRDVPHGNSLRGLVKHLDKMSDEAVLELNIPTGVPLVYELDEDLEPVKHYYLMDEKELKAKMEAVANQGKAK
ncbi:UNVERIFIED_CONTAM: hypothetical protein H355_004913 [Colinus virginianus]|nr:hypothetical protein H355_004913 [Colinus virginianus]